MDQHQQENILALKKAQTKKLIHKDQPICNNKCWKTLCPVPYSLSDILQSGSEGKESFQNCCKWGGNRIWQEHKCGKGWIEKCCRLSVIFFHLQCIGFSVHWLWSSRKHFFVQWSSCIFISLQI